MNSRPCMNGAHDLCVGQNLLGICTCDCHVYSDDRWNEANDENYAPPSHYDRSISELDARL